MGKRCQRNSGRRLFILHLTYCSPVDICFSEFSQSVPYQRMPRTLAEGIVVDNLLCLIACELHYLSVACYVGYAQVECHSALLCSLKVTRPTKLQVGLGNLESIVGRAHDVYSPSRVAAQLHRGDKQTETLICTAAHAPSELMKLL